MVCSSGSGINFCFTGGEHVHSFEFSVRNVPGEPFMEAVITSDRANIVVLAADKGHREAMYVFSCKTGDQVAKIPLRYSSVKVRLNFWKFSYLYN
mgnify:CR=1 FL=1